jgi:D-alanyl-lipoteichoic acid acyltransferase DltB (MBOAT superfamily)
MLFNSFAYAVFFPSVVIAYYALPHRARWLLVLLASCLFYLAFIPAFILILAFTIVVDFYAGILIEQARGARRKAWLAASIVANVSVLAVFKYFNFASSNLTWLLHALGASTTLPLLDFVLPVGLSFHTFQSMSYTIEVYRGKQAAERRFGMFALYVMYFPQLVAGPIERPQNLLPQFHREAHFDRDRAVSGLRQILWGLFKKVAIADVLAAAVDRVYADPESFSGAAIVLATYAFAVQIYCDFSGYSDIAIGSSRILGIELMTNFDHPYSATSVGEFWRRWHISLSTWFRDYVYFPLGGNRHHRLRNVAVVFLLSGLWHGANWTFLVWGALHALFMVIETALGLGTPKPGDPPRRVPTFVAWLVTLHLVVLAWIFFRASSLENAFAVIAGIFSGPFVHGNPFAELGLGRQHWLIVVPALVVLGLAENGRARRWLEARLGTWPAPVRWGVLYAAVLAVAAVSSGAPRQFIYFQF